MPVICDACGKEILNEDDLMVLGPTLSYDASTWSWSGRLNPISLINRLKWGITPPVVHRNCVELLSQKRGGYYLEKIGVLNEKEQKFNNYRNIVFTAMVLMCTFTLIAIIPSMIIQFPEMLKFFAPVLVLLILGLLLLIFGAVNSRLVYNRKKKEITANAKYSKKDARNAISEKNRAAVKIEKGYWETAAGRRKLYSWSCILLILFGLWTVASDTWPEWFHQNYYYGWWTSCYFILIGVVGLILIRAKIICNYKD